jgi:hypothetical protein
MPVPGPRTQYGPVPGYDNPDHAASTLFNLWNRPGPMYWPGRSPGAMTVTLRGCVLAVGQIRRLWRPQANQINAQAPFSWAENGPSSVRQAKSLGAFQITRALRYMTRSVYVGGGIDNSRYEGLHTIVTKENHSATVTVGHGQKRGQPTVRNRISSFGSRVPTLNKAVTAAENQPIGEASQA